MTSSDGCWQLTGGTLDYLRGRWQADRSLTDYRSRQDGSFRGVATFAAPGAVPETLEYRETGELRFGGHRGPAARSLLYAPGPDGTAEVLFADGRPFYVLDLRSGCWRAEHPCGADRYLVTLRVLGANSFTEQWRVEGPRKDYEMTTTLVRIGAAA